MSDWVKAFLLGVALAGGLVLLPILLALATPFLIFMGLVVVIWCLLRIFADDDHKPP